MIKQIIIIKLAYKSERGGKVYSNVLKRINKFDNYILFVIEKYVHNRYLDIIMPIVTLTISISILQERYIQRLVAYKISS